MRGRLTVVVDTSALLAVVLGEPGADYALSRLPDALMSAVNVAEAMSRSVDKTGTVDGVARLILESRIGVESFTADDASAVAATRDVTRGRGLSLGDRACLALARRLGLPALTADRVWAEVEVGVAVELIR